MSWSSLDSRPNFRFYIFRYKSENSAIKAKIRPEIEARAGHATLCNDWPAPYWHTLIPCAASSPAIRHHRLVRGIVVAINFKRVDIIVLLNIKRI